MCLLIHQTAGQVFTNEQLDDFYLRNPDGFGAIVKQPDGVKVFKKVGSLAEIQDLYKLEVASYEAVIHFRMKTHGDIDLFNCHPYQVTESLYMAHNGILSTGNAADQSKSDTWHYIENYLKPLLTKHPDLLHEPAFQKMLGSHIGASNKFAFMNGNGSVVIINKFAGVEHFNSWLSNTYAWTPGKWGYYTYDYASWQGQGNQVLNGTTYNRSKQLSLVDTQTTDGGKVTTKKSEQKYRKAKVATIERLSTQALSKIIRSCYNAYQRNQYMGLVDWVTLQPAMAMNLLYEFYKGQLSNTDIETMVNSDPDEAADWIEMCWNQCEEDMLAIAGVDFQPKKGATNGYVSL